MQSKKASIASESLRYEIYIPRHNESDDSPKSGASNDAANDAEGAVSGALDIPATSTSTSVLYKSMNGEIIHAEELGPQQAGLLGFRWENIPQDILDNNEYITVEAFADTGTGLKSVGSSVFGEVLAASASHQSDDVVYDVRGYGDINASDVKRFSK